MVPGPFILGRPSNLSVGNPGQIALREKYFGLYVQDDFRYRFRCRRSSQVALPAPSRGFANPFLTYPGGNPFPAPYPPNTDTIFSQQGVYINCRSTFISPTCSSGT
jgi:hypothetical protein